MRSEYIFTIVPYKLTEADKSEIEKDCNKKWNQAYKSYKNNLKEYLHKQQRGRCAFCRCRIPKGTSDITLEHIAPKSKYKNYRALAENLVNACIKCNRSKREEETFSDPAKSAQTFPKTSDGFIIVNPYYDNYEDYIEFIDDVIIQAKPGSGDKGKNTITFYNLARTELAEERAMEFKINYKNLNNKLMQRLLCDNSDEDDIRSQIKAIIDNMPNWICP